MKAVSADAIEGLMPSGAFMIVALLRSDRRARHQMQRHRVIEVSKRECVEGRRKHPRGRGAKPGLHG